MEDESNLHLWQFPEAITLLIPIFNNFAIKLQANADSLGKLQSDFVPYFLGLENRSPFQAAIKSKKRIKRLLLSFVHDLHVEIYNTIWKTRNSKFKEWKSYLKRPSKTTDVDKHIFVTLEGSLTTTTYTIALAVSMSVWR
ncbi:unnamed protein product [Rhizophagus irregularis]|nr:unnamed protein product [Rhizophagus irregularis]